MSNAFPPASVLSAAQQAAVTELVRVSPVLDELGAIFSAAGHQLHLVGGSVRDALLGRLGDDLDLTTDAHPEVVRDLLAPWADALWETGISFGTIGCRRAGFQLEITTYRCESYDPDSRKPAVAFGKSLAEDLMRRDFTINAMAVELPTRRFVDPHHGLADISTRIIRTPGTPESSFTDDPLRMLRAARFAAQLGFAVSPEVIAAMTAMTDRIRIVSAERIQAELIKLMCADRPRSGLTLLVETGLAEEFLPEIPKLRLEIDEHHRHKDVYEHSLTVLDQAIDLEKQATPEEPPDFILRFAALMHDIGKPRTRRLISGGGVSFHHHEVVGASLTAARMRALKFSKNTVDDVSRLVELHLRFHGYGAGEWTDSAVRRYVRDAGLLLSRLHLLTRADCTTRNQRKAAALAASYDNLERRIARLADEEEIATIRPDLTGTEIMEILDIPPGPLVGRAYRHLLELRLDAGSLDRATVVAELKRWHATQQ
jgi:poly(A) polymerase